MYDWGNRRLQAQFDTIGRADRLDLDSSFQRLTLLDVCSVGRLRAKGEELRVGIMSPLIPQRQTADIDLRRFGPRSDIDPFSA